MSPREETLARPLTQGVGKGLPIKMKNGILTPIVSILSLRMGSFSFLPIWLVAPLAFLKPINDS